MSRARSLEELREHAFELIKRFGIKMMTAKHVDRSFALPNQRAVAVVPITGEVEYAVLLHELGHILAPCGFLRPHMKPSDPVTLPVLRLIVEEERAAWEWAKHYAIDWTPTMEHICSITLGHYEQQLETTIMLERLGALLGPDFLKGLSSKPPHCEPAKPSRPTESMSDFLRRTKT